MLLDRNRITSAMSSNISLSTAVVGTKRGSCQVDVECKAAIGLWVEFLASLAQDGIVITKQEFSDPTFVHYGSFIDMDSVDFIRIHEISGAAKRGDELTLIPQEGITWIQTQQNSPPAVLNPFGLRPHSISTAKYP